MKKTLFSLMLLTIATVTLHAEQQLSINDIDRGKIEKLFKETADGLELDLSENQLTSLEGIDNLPRLKDIRLLDLSSNNISTIPTNAFQELPNLEGLDLTRNQITEIQPNAFQRLKNLKTLGLGYNNLTKIQPNTFQGLQNLAVLDLEHNNLTAIPTNAVQRLKNLTMLSLLGNNLSEEQQDALEDALPDAIIAF